MRVPPIGTRRLVLYPWSECHIGALHRVWTHPAVSRCIWDGLDVPVERVTETVREAVRTDSDGVGCWTVATASAPGSVFGFCALRPFGHTSRAELLVGFLPRYWDRGFGVEASHAALAYAFREGIECVCARTAPENWRAVRMLEKLGMQLDASTWIEDSPDLCFSLSREEFRRRCRTGGSCAGCGLVLSGCAA